jgi:hypothetical protein
MTILRAQVILASDSGLPEDVCINTFHFDTGVVYDSASAQSVIDRVKVFYNAIQARLSATINPDTSRIKIYDLADPKPRVPKEDQSLGMTETGPSSMAREVALVMSFQAAKQSGVAQARRRNRVFLGPLSISGGVTDADYRPLPTVVAEITNAAAALKVNATFGTVWVIRSQVGNFVAPVSDGWVDNAFDTQRRRGARPTARTLF